MSVAITKALAMNNEENSPDTTSPEYLARKKKQEEFVARLSQMFKDTGIVEIEKHDNDSQKDDSYTISFSNGIRKQTPEHED